MKKKLTKETAVARATTAVMYTRVSSKEQDREGFSLDAQEKLLRQYAERQGLRIVHHFVDVETAKQSGRGSFNEMLAYLKKNQDTCRIVLVEKVDRLYRNIKDWVTLGELDPELHFVKEGNVIARESRSAEKMMHGIRVVMAQNYIDNLSEETRKGMNEKAAQGLWPSKAPLGYLNAEREDGKKIIAPDPEVAPLITRLFELYATGSYSLKDAAKLMRDAGLRFKKSKSPVPRSTVNYMLRNPLYAGDFEWDGKHYDGKHEPLVSRELWVKVQAVLDKRNQTKLRTSTRDFAFSQLMTCAHCGCAIVGELKKGKYLYYHCTDFFRDCPKPYVREEVVEEWFTSLLKELTFDDEVLAWIRDALRASHADKIRFVEESIARLRAEEDRLRVRLDAMYDDKLDGRIDADLYDRKAAECRAELARVRAALEQHAAADASYAEQGIRLLEVARNAWRLFQGRPAAEKRKLLGFVLSNCRMTKDGIEADLKQPFDMLRESACEAQKRNAPGGCSEGVSEIWLRMGSGPLPLSDGARRDTLSAAFLAVPFSASPSPRARSVC